MLSISKRYAMKFAVFLLLVFLSSTLLVKAARSHRRSRLESKRRRPFPFYKRKRSFASRPSANTETSTVSKYSIYNKEVDQDGLHHLRLMKLKVKPVSNRPFSMIFALDLRKCSRNVLLRIYDRSQTQCSIDIHDVNRENALILPRGISMDEYEYSGLLWERELKPQKYTLKLSTWEPLTKDIKLCVISQDVEDVPKNTIEDSRRREFKGFELEAYPLHDEFKESFSQDYEIVVENKVVTKKYLSSTETKIEKDEKEEGEISDSENDEDEMSELLPQVKVQNGENTSLPSLPSPNTDNQCYRQKAIDFINSVISLKK